MLGDGVKLGKCMAVLKICMQVTCFGFMLHCCRVTILCNKFDGHPKGFAYIEFGDKDSVQTAMAMDESLFRGRQIKVRFVSILQPFE